METTNARRGTKSLKWFLLQRFLVIMLFIYISEELLGMGYRLIVEPFLAETMHIRFSVTAGSGSILLLMLQMLLLSAAALLPDRIAAWVQVSIGRNMENGLRVDITSPVLADVTDAGLIELYQVAVIFLFLILFALTLLPYFISAYWYYRAVSGKMKELLVEEKARKEAYDSQRNLLLSDIAHDIKTPLTTVCGYAKALVDDMVPEEAKRKEYLRAIYAKSLRMDDLITLLFEYVKMDSDGFSLHREKGDLGELLRENIALLYADFEENGIELDIRIPERAFPCEMDRTQMGRAVTNILTNAVRYNDRGTKVCVSLDEAYRIRIADNGTPIEDGLAAHIFEPFSRGDKTRSTSGGSGLGLSIASKIVQMHGGELRLERQCADGMAKAFVITL
ncbi:MAG: HAMP domain-containing histidine kinase [Blautia sp.]|nr:HAMP domain-containing histidine kinase [Blautia sp.]MCM1199950.1 HAMP domain-containing histidine kinase [Bacteroides fragilis]